MNHDAHWQSSADHRMASALEKSNLKSTQWCQEGLSLPEAASLSTLGSPSPQSSLQASTAHHLYTIPQSCGTATLLFMSSLRKFCTSIHGSLVWENTAGLNNVGIFHCADEGLIFFFRVQMGQNAHPLVLASAAV